MPMTHRTVAGTQIIRLRYRKPICGLKEIYHWTVFACCVNVISIIMENPACTDIDAVGAKEQRTQIAFRKRLTTRFAI